MTVQYFREGLRDWAGSDTMQINKAGPTANLCTVSVVGWHINQAHINDSVSAQKEEEREGVLGLQKEHIVMGHIVLCTLRSESSDLLWLSVVRLKRCFLCPCLSSLLMRRSNNIVRSSTKQKWVSTSCQEMSSCRTSVGREKWPQDMCYGSTKCGPCGTVQGIAIAYA